MVRLYAYVICMLMTLTPFILTGCADNVSSPLLVNESVIKTKASEIEATNVNETTHQIQTLAATNVANQDTDSITSNTDKVNEATGGTESVDAVASLDGFYPPDTLIDKPRAPVNDFTDTLTESERQALNDKIVKIYDEGLLQIGVVLVPTTGEISVFDYAMTVANAWQLGSPDNNNGVLILIAKDDQQMYILTGLDVEDTVTDTDIGNIIDDVILPEFVQNDFASGLSLGIDALVADMRAGMTE